MFLNARNLLSKYLGHLGTHLHSYHVFSCSVFYASYHIWPRAQSDALLRSVPRAPGHLVAATAVVSFQACFRFIYFVVLKMTRLNFAQSSISHLVKPFFQILFQLD